MQHFIDSSDSFQKLVEIGEKLAASREYCTSPYVIFPQDYSITDDIVFFCYSMICELILVDNEPGRSASIAIRQFDIEFLNNMLGDYLDESYFTSEFIKDFINRKLKEYSRVLVIEAPYFMYLCWSYDRNRKSNFNSQLLKSIDTIEDAYEKGRINNNLFLDNSDSFLKACGKQTLPFAKSAGEAMRSDLSNAVVAYDISFPEIAEFFGYNNTIGHESERISFAAGSRESPIPIGETGYARNLYPGTILEITIKEILRGESAYSILSKAEGFGMADKPIDRQEYIMAKVFFKMISSENEAIPIYKFDFRLIGQSGKNFGEPAWYYYMDGALALNMYGGTEQEDYLIYIVDENERPLIRFNELWFLTD